MKKAKRKNWLYLVAQILLTPFYHLLYRIKVIGKENVPREGPVLLCSNHVAAKDPVVLATIQKRQIFFMAKEELFRNRFLGKILRMVGAFPVKRGSGGSDALENACELLAENAIVGVFIEGTRSKTGELQKPKTGAALLQYRTKATVVPVCITGEGGKLPAVFKKIVIRFGSPIPNEALAIPDESSMQLRRASRIIMGEITALREATLREMGVAPPEETGEAE